MTEEIQNERIFYNALAKYTKGNYRDLQKIKEKFSTWTNAYESLSKKIDINPEKEWKILKEKNIDLLLSCEKDFPSLLKEIPFPPHALYVRGKIPADETTCVAMVGTRKASATGISTAATLAFELASHNIAIISGLAFGIDIASQKGALESGGKVVAVLASGVEKITPRSNTRLGEEIIAQGGAVISEYPVGTDSLPHYFLERNRIVSGLSRAVVVIEAPLRSGTLCTARFAIEQNRELLVVPGSITNPNFEGSHSLLKQGATLITCSKDVLEALGIDAVSPSKRDISFLNDLQKKIFEYLTSCAKPVHTDALCDALNVSAAEISESLTMLVIMNVIKETGGKYYV